jgi:hypothetical protein
MESSRASSHRLQERYLAMLDSLLVFTIPSVSWQVFLGERHLS